MKPTSDRPTVRLGVEGADREDFSSRRVAGRKYDFRTSCDVAQGAGRENFRDRLGEKGARREDFRERLGVEGAGKEVFSSRRVAGRKYDFRTSCDVARTA